MEWGKKYEPLSAEIYERRYKTHLAEFGCIVHPKYPFLGASPDGINDEPQSPKYGRMVEIKNIVNREIKSTPKDEHWIQTQVQMEVCDLNECDFVETRFKEFANEDEYIECNGSEKGIVIRQIQDNLPVKYYYHIHDASVDFNQQEWIDSIVKEGIYTLHYWYLDEFSCILIERDSKWFESVIGDVEELWNTIVLERQTGRFVDRKPKSRKIKGYPFETPVIRVIKRED
jgi:hypothetical protein